MSAEKKKLPFESPLVPELLDGQHQIKFQCYKGIECYNACCKQADITLTPYDVIRMKTRLGLSSTDFLAKHTVPFEMDGDGLMGIKLKTTDDEPVCLFMNDEGCSIYEDRPSACRYYPSGLMSMRAKDSPTDQRHFFVVKEDHCKGHGLGDGISVDEYREQQGVIEYDEANHPWYQIMLKKKSAGPAVGTPSPTSLQFFFMCSYDIDRFKRFIQAESFSKAYDVSPDEIQSMLDDELKLLDFSFRLMKQVLFGEHTIPTMEGAAEKRAEERKEILEMRRQIEIEANKDKQDPYGWVDPE
ncbi:MAG: YkgJ family cysteine cluster protein [Gammaproteobacteria bacterium]|nr:YkgJ family cysteine cluster protein [Gammaproteobacteria bacterium]MDH5729611.1 YkgJ family cysteine cluster protein [Gammaproteobacteria bacterium]